MSWPAVAWAMGQRAPSSASKFLLVVLADAASAGDWIAWPSVAYLSETTQQDRKTVLANLKRLEEMRLIEPHGKAGRTGQISVWRLPVVGMNTPGKSPKTGTVEDGETVPVFPGNSTSFPAKESQKRDTEPVLNQSGTKKTGESASRRCPQGFEVTAEMKAWAAEKCRGVDVEHETAAFRDHEFERKYSDWTATWRNWIRRAFKHQLGRRPKSGVGASSHDLTAIDYSKGANSDAGF